MALPFKSPNVFNLEVSYKPDLVSDKEITGKLRNSPNNVVYKDGTVVILVWHEDELYTYHRPYYVSKTGRWCFRFDAGLFEGMNPNRLHQFNDQNTPTMYTTPEKLKEDKLHFLNCVIRQYRRVNIKLNKQILSVSE